MKLQFTLDEIKQAAHAFWKAVADKKVFAFQGSMGAGKTTFIHALCDVNGVKDVVGSPTFSIINEYAFSEDGQVKKIFHIDLYRCINNLPYRHEQLPIHLSSDKGRYEKSFLPARLRKKHTH